MIDEAVNRKLSVHDVETQRLGSVTGEKRLSADVEKAGVGQDTEHVETEKDKLG